MFELMLVFETAAMKPLPTLGQFLTTTRHIDLRCFERFVVRSQLGITL